MKSSPQVQFSIAWLLSLIMVVAIIIAISPQGAPALLVILVFCVLCNFAAISVEHEGSPYFWLTTLAYVFLLPAASAIRSWNSHANYGAIFLALGLAFSLVPLLRSSLAVRIYAIPAFASYCALTYWLITQLDIRHLTDVY